MQDLTRKDTHKCGIEHAAKHGGIYFTQIVHLNVRASPASSRFAASTLDTVHSAIVLSSLRFAARSLKFAAQVVVISDPHLAAEVLDRTKTPHMIDKPTEPQFYKMMDEVRIRNPAHSCSCLSSCSAHVMKGNKRILCSPVVPLVHDPIQYKSFISLVPAGRGRYGY